MRQGAARSRAVAAQSPAPTPPTRRGRARTGTSCFDVYLFLFCLSLCVLCVCSLACLLRGWLVCSFVRSSVSLFVGYRVGARSCEVMEVMSPEVSAHVLVNGQGTRNKKGCHFFHEISRFRRPASIFCKKPKIEYLFEKGKGQIPAVIGVGLFFFFHHSCLQTSCILLQTSALPERFS